MHEPVLSSRRIDSNWQTGPEGSHPRVVTTAARHRFHDEFWLAVANMYRNSLHRPQLMKIKHRNAKCIFRSDST